MPAPLPCPRAEHCLHPRWVEGVQPWQVWVAPPLDTALDPWVPSSGYASKNHSKPVSGVGAAITGRKMCGGHPNKRWGSRGEAGTESPLPALSKVPLHPRFTTAPGACAFLAALGARMDGV